MPINNNTNTINLIINKKTTVNYELQFTDDGIVQDITGWTVYFTVKSNISDLDANAVIAKVITTHSDATNGKTLIELSVTDTNLSGNYFYSVDYKDDDGNEGVIMTGRVKFEKTVLNSR